MDHLFDARLDYVDEMPTQVPADDREGDYIGSGVGTIKGEKVTGTIRWSMFAADCAYLLVRAGVEPEPGQDLCRVHPGGLIETSDGARIRFDARGYGRRGADPSQPHVWRLSAALSFATDDPRYQWLNYTMGVWEGAFDESAGRAEYRAYARSQAAVPARQAIPVLGRNDGLEGLLRTQAFRRLLKTGTPVEIDELVDLAHSDRPSVAKTLGDLDGAGRIRRDEAGRVVASAGLSVVPSNHEIEIDGRRFWTWCAYDALGILGSLAKGGKVITQSPQTKGRIEVEFAEGAPLRQDLVLLMADSSDCVSTVEDFCPLVNLFENERIARLWMRINSVDGEVLTITEATHRGIRDWTPLLDVDG